MSAARLLRPVAPDEVPPARAFAPDPATLAEAACIVDDVRARGGAAVREHAERLGDLEPGAPAIRRRAELEAARDALAPPERELLERTAGRIRAFAAAQRRALRTVRCEIPGGAAGHWIAPVERAGCYAPGGRFPLPSSVLMSACTARAAGVAAVWVAAPRPDATLLAAAGVAGADALLAVGGAQAIAALAFGAGDVPACDVVVGPGNRWVTAAKQLVAGVVRIDMLAGPSELLVLADETAEPDLVAADLLAQAEHDPDARALLVTTDAALVARVEAELAAQLAPLSTADIARASLSANGLAVVCRDLDEAVGVCDRLAPEHLEVLCAAPEEIAPRLAHYGAVFLGRGSAEVLGDYGAGPNHVLPTGGSARSRGGLSALDFLRVRTWMHVGPDDDLARDAAALARLEGLEAHARSAERRAQRGRG